MKGRLLCSGLTCSLMQTSSDPRVQPASFPLTDIKRRAQMKNRIADEFFSFSDEKTRGIQFQLVINSWRKLQLTVQATTSLLQMFFLG